MKVKDTFRDRGNKYCKEGLDSERTSDEDPEERLSSDDIEKEMEIVPRDAWGAQPPKDNVSQETPVNNVWFIYNTGVKPCKTPDECVAAIKKLQRINMEQKNLPDIAYNFLVGGDGRVYEGRGWTNQSPMSKTYPDCNGNRIDVGYLGDLRRKQLTFKMVKGGLEIVSYGIKQNLISSAFKTKEWVKPGEELKKP